MSESANRFKTNLKLQGQPCGHCTTQLLLGDDAAVCASCAVPHHAPCWDDKAGCSKADCQNAPLQQLQQQAQAPSTRPGFRPCPSCRAEITLNEDLCPYCNAITSADGLYHGPQENAPGAVGSLVWGIIGVLFCGIILGIVAIVQSNKAKAAISMNPRYKGEGMATAGLVLGIVGIVLHALVLLARVASI